MKKNIAVIFGGRTSEHDVSIITGLQACENLDKNKYNIHPVYISREGEWFTGSLLLRAAYYEMFNPFDKKITGVFLSSNANDRFLYENERKIKRMFEIDCALLAMHGANGEDGSLQGLMELKGIPYTSSNICSSAVCMDKIVTKAYLKGLQLPVLDCISFDRNSLSASPVIGDIESSLGYPVFVKPATLGSSIGISKAANRTELESAIELAFNFDTRVLVEHAVTDITEVNCAVLGFGSDLITSAIEQPLSLQEFLTFEEKYLRCEGTKSSGMKSLKRKIPADISPEMSKQVVSISKKIFTELNLSGVVRIDYIIDKSNNTLYVNELNTIPGSFAFYLFEPMGISFSELLDKLIELAETKLTEQRKSTFTFTSDILKKIQSGIKK